MEESGPVADWAEKVARLRNRVVHGGYRPSRLEVEAAASSYEALERFVGDRLAASIREYPLAAEMFLGEPGLTRRNALKRLESRLEGDHRPRDCPAVFARWRAEFRRHVEDGPWRGDAGSADVFWVRYPNGEERWWLLDHGVGLACLAVEPPMSDSQRTSMDRLRGDLAAYAPENAGSARIEGRSRPLETPPKWVPICDALPLNEISRYPCSLIPPPLVTRLRQAW